MISIIIEKSMDQMQVFWVYKNPTEDIRDKANRFFEQWRLVDYDVLNFETEDDMNEFLRNEVLLPDEDE